jgi:hypothetical protein
MAKKDRQAHTDGGTETAATQNEAALRRAIRKVAWTRMNGKNDAMNPFEEHDVAPAAHHADSRRQPRG